MSIDIYKPTKLSSELERFRINKGNVIVDYRSPDVGTINVLDTPYEIDYSNIRANISPLKVEDVHISGDNKYYRFLTLDFIINNNEEGQKSIFILNSKYKTIMAEYVDTRFKIEGGNKYLVHNYTLLTPLPSTQVDILPFVLDKEIKEEGLIDTTLCYALRHALFENTVSVDIIDTTSISITRSTDLNYNNNDQIPKNVFEAEISNLSGFFFSQETQPFNNKITPISLIKEDLTTNNVSVLSVNYPNYGYYLSENNVLPDDIIGYNCSVKEQESLLFNYYALANTDNLTSDSVLNFSNLQIFSDTVKSSGSFFICLKTEFPVEIPETIVTTYNEETEEEIQSLTPMPFFTRINDNLYTSQSGFTTNTEGDFYTYLKDELEPLDIYLFQRKNGFWFIYNYGTSDLEIQFVYSDFKVISEEDIRKTESIHNTNNTNMDLSNNWLNTSLGLDYTEYPNEGLYTQENNNPSGVLDFSDISKGFRFYILGNSDKETLACMYNYITFDVDVNSFSTAKYFNYTLDTTFQTDNLTLNYSSLTPGEVLEALRLDLENSLLDFTITKDEVNNTITITNSLTNRPFKFEWETDALTISNSFEGLYRIVDNTYMTILSRGV